MRIVNAIATIALLSAAGGCALIFSGSSSRPNAVQRRALQAAQAASVAESAGTAIDTNTVSVGCFVKIHDLEYDEKDEFKIVGSAEANYAERKISNESVLGAALIGHKKNDIVEVRAPAGVSQYKILNIRK